MSNYSLVIYITTYQASPPDNYDMTVVTLIARNDMFFATNGHGAMAVCKTRGSGCHNLSNLVIFTIFSIPDEIIAMTVGSKRHGWLGKLVTQFPCHMKMGYNRSNMILVGGATKPS